MSSHPSTDQGPAKDERFLDSALRPSTWDEYVGQETIKNNLKILLRAAKERAHPPEHLLFYGPPGLGKTTLAYLIAKEMATQIKVTSGPAIEKVGDVASILTNLSAGDILFIDEIHRLHKSIEEVLYPAMESGSLHIIIGKGPSARTIQLDLPPFTLIAATTYTEKEIERIINRSAKILGVDLESTSAEEIASRSRKTPRIANHFLKRVRDYAQVHKVPLNTKSVKEALALLEIDELGLGTTDRKILATMIEKFAGGPVGLSTIAAAISEEEATIEEVNEPYLLQEGLLERTPRGRVVTTRGYVHLGYDVPKSRQEKLL